MNNHPLVDEFVGQLNFFPKIQTIKVTGRVKLVFDHPISEWPVSHLPAVSYLREVKENTKEVISKETLFPPRHGLCQSKVSVIFSLSASSDEQHSLAKITAAYTCGNKIADCGLRTTSQPSPTRIPLYLTLVAFYFGQLLPLDFFSVFDFFPATTLLPFH